MAYTQILVVLTSAADDADTIAVGAELAKTHGAVARVLPAYPRLEPGMWAESAGMSYFSAEAWEALAAGEREMQGGIERLVKETSVRFGLDGQPQAGRASMLLAPQAATLWGGLLRELPLVDLVVVGQSCVRRDGAFSGVLDNALMDYRAPLLVVRGPALLPAAPAMVAWDGSLQAGRALRAAMPLLRQASRITVLQDPDRLDESERAWADPRRVAEYLQQAGAAHVSVQLIAGQWPGLGLAQTAVEEGAGLIVAGAFGHARVREALFGGATNAFLTDEKGPHLLLAH